MRQLDWEGGLNVRDLGGLRTRDGGETARGAVVRSGSPDGLSQRGWEALRAYGIRTIVDLRNDDERDAEPRAGLDTLHLPLDGVEDEDFWSQWASGPEFGTGLYYRPHLDRFPERNARVIEGIARAEPGGVLFHCVGGRDRTGQITLLLLSLAGAGQGARLGGPQRRQGMDLGRHAPQALRSGGLREAVEPGVRVAPAGTRTRGRRSERRDAYSCCSRRRTAARSASLTPAARR